MITYFSSAGVMDVVDVRANSPVKANLGPRTKLSGLGSLGIDNEPLSQIDVFLNNCDNMAL